MPQQFAHISDPHLSSLADARLTDMLNKRLLSYISWRRKRRLEHRREVLDALTRDLANSPNEQLVITGDLTHVGLPSEFQQSQQWLRELGPARDVAVVPGNHDACVKASAAETFDLWREYLSGDECRGDFPTFFPTQRVRGDLSFIGLNSGCPKPPLMATGTLGRAQLDQLPQLLDAAAEQGKFRVVYLHHCPLPGREKWRKRLTDAPQVLDILQRHGVELVLHGHGHRTQVHQIDGDWGMAPVIAVPSASGLGLHGADRAAYNRYQVQRTGSGWQLSIQTRRYGGDNNFESAEARQFELKRL